MLPNTSPLTKIGTPRNVSIGGVIGRKPCRGRMRGDSVGSNRARFSNDQAQQAVSFGKMPDLGNLPLSQTGVDESGQASVGGFHAERAVVRFEEMSRDVDYLLQGFVELECGPDGQHGTEQFGNCSRVESSQLCASGDVAERLSMSASRLPGMVRARGGGEGRAGRRQQVSGRLARRIRVRSARTKLCRQNCGLRSTFETQFLEDA